MSKILVVEDTAIFREPIAATLRAAGYTTLCASDGRQALDVAKEEHPDLILMDIAMPKMDGLSCLREIRVDFELRETPVIMLTAMAERELVQRAVGGGVQGYLLKSQFSLQDMLARIRTVLDSAEVPTATAQLDTPAVLCHRAG